MASSKNGKYKKIKTIKKSKTVKYTKGSLKSNKKYWFKIRAYKLNGKKKVYGKFSIKKSAITKKSTVTSPKGYDGKIQVVHVNDMHTYLDDTGKNMGYAKAASFYNKAKAENENTIFLDAGDCFFGTANGTVDQGEWMVPIVNTMGITAMVTGNHEYTYGTAQLLKLTNLLDHPTLCANIVYRENEPKAGEQPFASYEIKTLPNGMKIGIIGLTTPTSESMGAADIMYVDAVKRAKETVAELKGKVDMTIPLCHIGHNDSIMNTTMIADEVEGLDLIIDGHSHLALQNGDRDNKTNTLIAQTGEYSENIGLVTVDVKDDKMKDAKAQLYSASEVSEMGISPKAQTQNLIDKFNAYSKTFFAEIVGSTEVELNGASADIRTKETNMGNLYADVMRAETGADIGLFKVGPISTVVTPIGDITKKDLANMTRVDSLIIKKSVKGQDIIDFLNYSLASWPSASGSFQQVSGITFKIDENAVPGESKKIFDIKVNGSEIDLEKEYSVATILGSNEENGMREGTLIQSYDFSNTIMNNYIQSLPDKKITTNEAYIDGRISTGVKP